ncbi:hypothetical protein ACQPXH_01010 [Nocardia sp. CA-135953]|uniref:hypothetical protein n=1 Tax=Nocardia sp. CA-135953 TaxID=3239978 RepID=UPI003D97823B
MLGRSIVIHAGTDDLGRGVHADSLTTGNSGGGGRRAVSLEYRASKGSGSNRRISGGFEVSPRVDGRKQV